jgi:hypothetical protein
MLRKYAGLGLAAVLLGTASAQGLGKGAWEISGMGDWSYADDSGPGPNTITTRISLSPALLAYPSRYLFLGPILDYTRVKSEVESESASGISGSETLSTRWDLGLKAGILANWSDARFRPLPYLGAAAGLSTLSVESDPEGAFEEDSRLSDNGHFFAFFLGGKLRLSESFYMNIQPTVTFVTIGQVEALIFRVGTGFSGTF